MLPSAWIKQRMHLTSDEAQAAAPLHLRLLPLMPTISLKQKPLTTKPGRLALCHMLCNPLHLLLKRVQVVLMAHV